MKETTSDEQYILDESQEIAFGESKFLSKFFAAFPALKYRNYQLYFSGQLVSFIGTWMQIVAQGWLVLQISHSAFWVGAITAIDSLPILLLSGLSGVVIDRYPKRKIIFATESAMMFFSLLMGILTLSHQITLFEIGLLAFLSGIASALDLPARQSFAVEMVGREDLSSAIALNSGIFNAARVIGPSIAGFAIAIVGIGGAFIIDAVSFIAVLLTLFLIKVEAQTKKTHPHPIAALKEGFAYSFSHKTIQSLLLFAAMIGIFGWSYGTILPVIVSNSFHLGADTLGFFYAASGVGALLATIVISASAKKIAPSVFIFGGMGIFIVSLFLFSLTTTLPLALFFLFCIGFGLIGAFSTVNAVVQANVTDGIRGRVMGIYTLMFIGMMPIGNLEIGALTARFGSSFALEINVCLTALATLVLFLRRGKLSLIK